MAHPSNGEQTIFEACVEAAEKTEQQDKHDHKEQSNEDTTDTDSDSDPV